MHVLDNWVALLKATFKFDDADKAKLVELAKSYSSISSFRGSLIRVFDAQRPGARKKGTKSEAERLKGGG